MAKSVGNIRGLHEVLDAVGGDVLILFFSRRPLPPAAGLLARSASRTRGARPSGSARPAGGWSPGPSPDGAGAATATRFFAALRNDFNTAEALASLYGWIREANRSDEAVGDSHLREMLDVLGLIGLLAADEGPPEEAVELADAARGRARGQATGRRPTGCATSCARWAGRSATDPDGPELVPAS